MPLERCRDEPRLFVVAGAPLFLASCGTSGPASTSSPSRWLPELLLIDVKYPASVAKISRCANLMLFIDRELMPKAMLLGEVV
jgi:hypothetical protein